MKIGIFDSGLGGITVLNEIYKSFPENNYIYFADLKNMPYGSKSNEDLINIGVNILKKFEKYNVDEYICACGTLSSTALPNLESYLLNKNKKIYGIIDPIVESVSNFNGKNILLIATEATIKKGIIEEKIKGSCKDSNVYAKACPEFVDAIENHIDDEELLQNITYKYLNMYKNKVDIVVCGCTHYILFEKYIKNVLENVKIIEAGKSIIKQMQCKVINNNEISKSNNSILILQSKQCEKFQSNVKKILKNSEIIFKIV